MIDTDQNTAWPVLQQSLHALSAATAGVTDWGAPTPCAEWTARQVLEHAAADQLVWASTVGDAAGPGYDGFHPSGREPGSATQLLAPAVEASTVAFAAVTTDAPLVSTPLPQGALPPAAAAAACALDAAVHAWDIAAASGQSSPLTDELAEALLPTARAIVEPLRQYGVFAAALPAEAGDGAAHALLRYLGRDPRWQPTGAGRTA